MIGIRIKILRNSLGLTQKQLGTHLGLGESTISQYENENRTPDYETLNHIADFFDVSTDYLLGRTNIQTLSRSPHDSNRITQLLQDLPPEDIEKLEEYAELLKFKRENK